jgi:hypothetical protein
MTRRSAVPSPTDRFGSLQPDRHMPGYGDLGGGVRAARSLVRLGTLW